VLTTAVACSGSGSDDSGSTTTGSGSSSSKTSAVSPDTKVLVALPLGVDTAGLSSLAAGTADPSDARYHHFTDAATIASTFGADPAAIAHDRAALRALGIDLTADPTRAALWGTVTARQVQDHFGTTLVERDGVVVPDGDPTLPPGLTAVTGVVGLTAGSSRAAAGTSSTAATSGTTAACPSDVPTRAALASRFGFDRALDGGAVGAGTTIAIVATTPFAPGTFAEYGRCAGTTPSTANLTQTSLPGTPPVAGGDEVALDALVLTLLAPAAHLDVVHFDAATSLAFPLLAQLTEHASPVDVLDVTSVWCEHRIGKADLHLSEWLLAAAAAMGTTTVAAAGDTGSSGCYPDETTPSVTYPASSAFAVAVGGADYGGTPAAPTGLAVWNEHDVAGGGGGTSTAITRPPWQTGSARAVPDVAAYAVPGGIGSIPVCSTGDACSWQAVGGTSLSATVLGATALLLTEAGGGDGTSRWGNLAGALWRRSPSAPSLHDIVDGANTTFDGSCCRARTGYDRASGWGLIDPDAITGAVPR
jgi:subtilase family serine protease